MARGRRQSVFEDLIDIAATLPWEIDFVLAGVSYAVLHVVAGMKPHHPVAMNDLGKVFSIQAGATFASFGQYLLPCAFLSGALLSFFKQRKNRQMYDSIAAHSPAEKKRSALQALERLTWQEFEMLVGESFLRQGYEVKETGGGGADGGIDLELSLDGQKYLVQCKQWKVFKVGIKVVREFFGVMVANGAKGGFVVTSGDFTEEAVNFAEDTNITLIDGARLLAIIDDAGAGRAWRSNDGQHQDLHGSPAPKAEPSATPLCPRCHNTMVKRTAKQGQYAGKEFWGCSQYPKCKGVSAINALPS